MKRPIFLIGAIVALLVASLVYAFLSKFEYVTTETTGRPTGPASYNSLYALHRMLEALEVPSSTRAYLDLETTTPDAYGTLVSVTDPGTLSAAQVDALLTWIETGGHLVVALPAHGDIEAGTLLSLLGVRIIEPGTADCLVVHTGEGADAAAELGCNSDRFAIDAETALALADDQGLLLARVSRGEGFVTVASSLDFLMNDELDAAGNARLASVVLEPNFGYGSFELVYSVQAESLLRIVATRASSVVFASCLLLLAWLSMRMRRFGPQRGAEARPRRALLEHIAASAHFLERSGLSEHLRVASERRLLQLVRKRYPHMAAMKAGERHAALASATGMKASDIARAFEPATQAIGSAERIMLLARLGKML